MQDEKGKAESVTPTKESAERDATSKETVSDVEEGNQASGGKAGATSGDTASSAAPSPDGQFDGSRDNAGEDPGPM